MIWRFFRDWWYGRCRRKDLEILWPACRQNAKSLGDAKYAFGEHAYRDQAWLILGREHIHRIIDALE